MTVRTFSHSFAALATITTAAVLPLDAVAYENATSDRRALEAFYDSTGGPNWTDSTNWKTSAPLEEWYGVRTDAAGRVKELNLNAVGLTGTIPPVLGSLTKLKWIYLSDNSLTGPIPPELANLAELEVLAFPMNDLTGPIPAWLGNLPNLRVIQLYENDLTGPIPSNLANLAALEHLELSRNELDGPIPALGSLARLESLILDENDFSGLIPASLTGLSRLKQLRLSYNWGLWGELPLGLSALPRLEKLDWIVTGACASPDWREWLATIDYWSGPLCEAETELTIDVAVFYTPAAREEAGGVDEIEAIIDLMLAETNDAYAASGVRHRLALAARSEVPYVERGGDLLHLEDPSDGLLDEVHGVRDRTGADLVHLVAGGVHGLCGVAALTGAFGVTYQRCGGLTFAHEIGHNLGLYHDRFHAQANESGAFSTPAYGYVNQRAFEAGSSPSSHWTTIMAYDSQCSLGGHRCAQLLRFSNPRQHYGGDPLGVAHGAVGTATTGPADAVAVINATGAAVAAWRDRPPDAENRPPFVAEVLPDRRLASAGGKLTVVVSRAFADPDGDAVVYTASSSAPQVVQAVVSGARLTLTAGRKGEARIRVTATDSGGLSVSQLFSTAVEADDGAARDGGPPDRVVLEKLFEATAGAGWGNNSNWRTTAPLHEWLGVTTDAASRVTELDLSGNDLTGSIPPELGRLENLVILNLSGNDLTGSIPPELGRLENLQDIYLMNNRLTGSIPPELGRLESLAILRLDRNALSGPIPGALGALANLQHLVLSQNELTGVIPDELGNLERLTALDLSRNDLTGSVPTALGALNLWDVSLSHNWGLTGSLPAAWQQSEIENLDIFLTQTCAPAAWREWLATIRFFGLRCGAEPVPVDVAVAYTPAAREAAGGTAAIEAEIDFMVATTNEIFAASGVRQRVALVGRSEVAYAETTGGSDLHRLADPSDGHLDEAHDLRDRVGADLLHLLVAFPYDVCGIATFPGPYQDPAPFGITARSCGALTFAHELGHNMGLRHDRFQVQVGEQSSTFSHPAYGYVNQRASVPASPPSSRWRTIMSYPGQCKRFDTSCVALPRFSNPRQYFNGEPLGTAHRATGSGLTGAADAAAVLDVTGPTVAAWRDRVDRPNRPPTAVGALRERRLALNQMLELDVSSAFADSDGDALTYTVSSSPPVVAAHVAGTRVTLTAAGVGQASITLTAIDSGRLSATHQFLVHVTEVP
ncbi:MAG: M12 family metallo-peptidase [Bryobacterales bacterium]|nr:M12 family metallo-peptidase [Bryobacterales bacterium]MDE0627089.1 M12 family metallo-peptidase [Bryobacterales bacterium]